VSIDLGPVPPPVEVAPTPPSRRPLPRPEVRAPTRGKAFDPRLVVPLDLLDPALPSSREVGARQRQERARRLRNGVMIVGGVLIGLIVGVVTMLVMREKAPEPLPPELDVSFAVQSDPPGAEVFVDGKSTGLMTPTQLTGWDFTQEHQVSIELRGYYPEHRKVATGLHPPDLNVQLPRIAHLTATTLPVPAAVMIDGEVVGTTPADVDVPADRDLKLVVRASGFVPLRRELRLKPDESMRIAVTLDPLSMLTVKSTPPGAKVSVDGAPPVLAPAEIEITAGLSHRVDAWVLGLAVQSTSVKVATGKAQQLEFYFEDSRDRRARAELSRLRRREATDRSRLTSIEARGGNEYIDTAHKLNMENSINDHLDRIEAREQLLEDQLASHEQELEDRIKTENTEARAKPAAMKAAAPPAAEDGNQ
jgi:hypothetical protein